MKPHFLLLLMAGLLLVPLTPAWGRPPVQKPHPPNATADKLVQEGDTFLKRGQTSGALWAYRQAAKAGSVKGAFAAGNLLLRQGAASRGRGRILQLAEGLGDLFFAATNGNARACARLADALENGLGAKTNLVAAYAWLELAANRDAAFKPELDRLVVQLDPDEVLRAQAQARDYAHGHWPTRLVRPVDQGDPRLKIQGLTRSGRHPLVIVNDVTLAKGDTVSVRPVNQPRSAARLAITCREIGPDYVLLSVAGESHLKLLSTARLQQMQALAVRRGYP